MLGNTRLRLPALVFGAVAIAFAFGVERSATSAPPNDDAPTSRPAKPKVSETPAVKEGPMGAADARHFLARTGFGGTLKEIGETAKLTREAAVDQLLAKIQPEALQLPPAYTELPLADRRPSRGATREERQMFNRVRRQEMTALRGWWAAEMALTDSPFTERLTLFWHNHFVSESRKVKDADLMYHQNALLRRHAAGNFGKLLREISTDGAMVIYLDSQQNRRGKPNENYARELYELFTLGEGHYTEDDIRETARALTGWRVNRRENSVNFVNRLHDRTAKTIFGKTGRHTIDDVIQIVLEKPQVANHIVGKLWAEFVSPDRNEEEIAALAKVFRESNYELRPLYRALFLTPSFWVETNRGALFRSPADLVIGTARVLGLERVPPGSLVRAMGGMGQALFDPPNVKGWPGGERWITTDSLLTRRQFIERSLLGLAGRAARGGTDEPSMGGDSMGGSMDDGNGEGRTDRRRRGRQRRNPMTPLRDSWMALGSTNRERAEALEIYLSPLGAITEPKKSENPGETLSRLLLDPTYQLK